MLRIVALETPDDGAMLSLEGRLIGPWVGELRQSCEGILGTGATLTLDLAEVAFVDRPGVRLLKHLVDGGVAVVNCPAFVAEQLKALSPC
jgi:ABC-type transporter Mla MlaB component